MGKKLKKNMTRREKRIKKTAEIFTPDSLVNEILDKMPKEIWEDDEENTFLDLACGNGNILVHILWRKISNGILPIDALKSIYGLDIMADNIAECRYRMLKIISVFEDVRKEHIQVVFQNIRYLSPRTCSRGSLDYDMKFRNNYNTKDVDRWYQEINNGKLDSIELPVKDFDKDPGDIFDIV